MQTAKPDPSEPWRYCCPNCDSVMVRRLLEPSIASRDLETARGGIGVQARKEKLGHRYTCNECSWRGKTVVDRKQNGRSDPWDY